MEEKIKITVITPTNREAFAKNIIENYHRQTYPYKELIIIINKDTIPLGTFKEAMKKDKSIRVYKLPETVSLGHCLNFGVEKAKYDYIAKIDDDDYYGSKYLEEVTEGFKVSGCEILGKRAIFCYFKQRHLKVTLGRGFQNRFMNDAYGATLCFKKSFFEKIKYGDYNQREDVNLCRKCRELGIKVYSTSIYNYLYIRRGDGLDHTMRSIEDTILSWKETKDREEMELEALINWVETGVRQE